MKRFLSSLSVLVILAIVPACVSPQQSSAGQVTAAATIPRATATPLSSATPVTPTAIPFTPTPTLVPYISQTACDHPYLPLRQGARWNWKGSNWSGVWVVTGVKGDNNKATAEVTFTDTLPNGTVVKEIFVFQCSGNNLVGDLETTLWGDLIARGTPLTFSGAVGTFLPSADLLKPGYQWSIAYEVLTSRELPQVPGGPAGLILARHEKTKKQFTLDGFEQVTVNGLVYHAIVVSILDERDKGSGSPGQLKWEHTEYKYQRHFARGVGMIDHAQLESFNIP